jgi:hypothetical protein
MTTWGFHGDTAQQVHLVWFLGDQEDAIDVLRRHDLAHQLCATMWGQFRTSRNQQRADVARLPKNLKGACVQTRTNAETHNALARFDLVLHTRQGNWNCGRADVAEVRKRNWSLR